jgi:hypothetical protein
MKRFTIPRVAHCSDGCKPQSPARPKTADAIRNPQLALGVSSSADAADT